MPTYTPQLCTPIQCQHQNTFHPQYFSSKISDIQLHPINITCINHIIAPHTKSRLCLPFPLLHNTRYHNNTLYTAARLPSAAWVRTPIRQASPCLCLNTQPVCTHEARKTTDYLARTWLNSKVGGKPPSLLSPKFPT